MAEKVSYPQIPSRVWWGIRDLLARSPSARIDDSTIVSVLGVQPVAARQYLAELKRINIIDDRGQATDLANRWRLDDDYEGAVEEILQDVYPDTLVALAPSGSADRATVERWFASQGLGSGTAKNKAGTYVMIANGRPDDSKPKAKASSQARKKTEPKKSNPSPQAQEKKQTSARKPEANSKEFPLNVNVQIHISSDASSDQIESIFSSMRKYLYDD
ncbi:hypothetical protein FKB34_01200 [Glycocaulis profundi]|nr:hypothetical protein FKB34_01200 [Glycocaulis profundi]